MFDRRTGISVSEYSDAEFALAERIRAAQEEAVSEGLLPFATPNLVQVVAEDAELFAEAVTQKYRDPLTQVACKAGCTHCCYQLVPVSAPEAFRIVRYIERNFEEGERAALEARVQQLDKATRGMNSKARVNVKRPCAFLGEDNRCTVYAVRPLACSEFTSFNVQDCKRGKRLGFKPLGVIHEKARMLMFNAVRQGLKDGLAKALPSVDSNWLELTAAVVTALDGRDAEDEWLNGSGLFARSRLNVSG